MIEVVGVSKTYGRMRVVEDLSFAVRPGLVTGFLGPNGSGKTTTMRMIAGLARPDGGAVRVDGSPFAELRNPAGALGVLVDAGAGHPGRTAFRHLQALGAASGIGVARVRDVLEMVGLGSVQHRRIGTYSLGMSQRLGIATALLADPSSVILDEPINGLDPDGVLWVRTLVKRLAAEGRAVLISSHLMSEMALTADRVVVIGRGRLIADETVSALVQRTAPQGLILRTPQAAELSQLVLAQGGLVSQRPDGYLQVDGLTAEAVGDIAATHAIRLHELIQLRASLEDAFMELTADAVTLQRRGGGPAGAGDGASAPTALVNAGGER